jgi:hypothetical protein
MGKAKGLIYFVVWVSSTLKKKELGTALPHCTNSPTAHFTEKFTAVLVCSDTRPFNFMNRQLTRDLPQL